MSYYEWYIEFNKYIINYGYDNDLNNIYLLCFKDKEYGKIKIKNNQDIINKFSNKIKAFKNLIKLEHQINYEIILYYFKTYFIYNKFLYLRNDKDDRHKNIDFLIEMAEIQLNNLTINEINSIINEIIDVIYLYLQEDKKIKQLEISNEKKIKQLEISNEKKIKELEIENEEKIKQLEIENEEKIKQLEIENEEKIKQIENYNQEVKSIKDTVNGFYREGIYDDEYNLSESKYIIKEPIHHLNVEKICEDLQNNCCDISNVNNETFIYKSETETYEKLSSSICGFKSDTIKRNIYLNFPLNHNLYKDEFIVKIYKLDNDKIIVGRIELQSYRKDNTKTMSIIYITNYGRIIKASYNLMNVCVCDTFIWGGGNGDRPKEKTIQYRGIDTKIIEKNKLLSLNVKMHIVSNYYGPKMISSLVNDNKINTDILPKLLFRIPKIFIDVIDSFYNQDTELMQKCCKLYLDITRETTTKYSILKECEVNKIIKEKNNITEEKNAKIEEQQKLITEQQEEIKKLKADKLKLQKALNELINT